MNKMQEHEHVLQSDLVQAQIDRIDLEELKVFWDRYCHEIWGIFAGKSKRKFYGFCQR